MVTGTPRMITDGLVLYVDAANTKSYPGSGTNWFDLLQSEFSGSLQNGVLFGTEANGIMRFDGTNDYIRISHNSKFNLPTAYTISYWLKIGKVIWTFGDLIISKRLDGQNINYQTYVGSGSTTTTPGPYYSVGFGGNTAGSFWGVGLSGSAQQLELNKWYHIAGTYLSNRLEIYVNGLFITGSSGLPALATSTANINISGYNNGGNPISGSMGNVWIYNRALSASEVLQNYEATRERFGV